MPTLAAAARVAALIALLPSGAWAASLDAAYRITLAGLPLGSASLRLDVPDGRRYEIRLESGLKGLVGALVDGKGTATARGRIGHERPMPRAFLLDARYYGTPLSERMALDDGDLGKVEIEPRPLDRPDRVAAGPGDRKRVLDPLSAIVVRRVGKGVPTPAECDRTLPVHDGTMRFDIVLSRGEALASDVPAFSGPVVACRVRYVPVSGHRIGRPGMKFMEANDDMRVWLAPVAGTDLMAPVRISVDTGYGTALVEAVSWLAEGGPRPGAKAAR